MFIINDRQQTSRNPDSFSNQIASADTATLDEISTTGLAARAARRANLSIANNVAQLYDTLNTDVATVADNNQYRATPTIIRSNARTLADKTTHTVKEGEDLSSIAGKYGVSSDTIKWANNLLNNIIPIGRELVIPPVDGVLYVAEDGDTIESLADIYDANKARIIAFNDLEKKTLEEGLEIMIPGGIKPAPVSNTVAVQDDPDVIAGAPSYSSTNYNANYGSWNLYAFGNCTLHAAKRRAEVGQPIPNNLGNAISWAANAVQAGFAVSENSPQVHDVLWHKSAGNQGYGHVAFVETVHPDGSVTISEMNYYNGSGGGFNSVSFRDIPVSDFGLYQFIH